ncbi:histone-like nucleoid-structuring protein Lsr2 [Microbacterium sp. Leaf151]|uniref:histone-like nucleoid-structuring protein Lsr2 n=1 Tax=Microbacterium sp. Leaf151 TaxID=1736276 RepID=UPI0006FD3AD6|nr:Lsr2 family protein [Microbacterium sp. Leaf151]KQR25778.1 hypothetical protein ASF76_00275 [Microbacterium sp. Leaf151]
MATRTYTSITDDIDGSEDASPVTFAFDGTSYSIDLSARNRKKLEDALALFIEHGTRDGTSGKRTPKGSPTWNREELKAWAKENGHKVSDRGRVPQAIVDAYLAAR